MVSLLVSKMASKMYNASIIFLFLSLLFTNIPSISAFNITFFLDQHPEFSTFNHLLTQTGVAAAINKQGTVSVLVLDNSAVGPLSGQSQSTIHNVLATHVILDYFDKDKLDNMEGKSAKATNLYQQSGKTNGAQGLLNISNSGGQVVFASAAKGAPKDSKLVKVVASKPSHISVIQITKPIVTPGLDLVATAPTSPSGSPKAAPPTDMAAPPPKDTKGTTPAPSPSEDEDTADSPMTDSESPAPSSGAPAPGPASEGEEADKERQHKPEKPKNGGARLTVGGGMIAAFMGLVALLAHRY